MASKLTWRSDGITTSSGRWFSWGILILSLLMLTQHAIARPARTKPKTAARNTHQQAQRVSAPVGEVASVSLQLPDEKTLQLRGRTINGMIYLPLDLIAQQLSDSTHQEREVTQTEGSKIRCAPTGFFVSRESRIGMRFAQMSVPALWLQGKTYVPVPHFFTALQTLGIYEVEAGEQDVVLKPYLSYRIEADLVRFNNTIAPGERGQKKTDEEGHGKTTKTSTERNPGSSNPSVPTRTTPSVRSAPPSRYQLPPDLKRRELEETPKKESTPKKEAAPKNDSRLYHQQNPTEPWLEEGSFASLLSNLKISPAKITQVYAEVHDGKTSIHFIADKQLQANKQPTLSKQTIQLRLAGAVNGVHSLDNIRKLNFRKVRTYLDGEEQVYEFTLKRSDRKAELQKVDAKHVVLLISPVEKTTANNDKEKKKWNLDVIVIDAGHGGKDTGAESINGFFEKDVALSIALKLRDQIKKLLPNTKVVMTRSTDVFVDLYERGEIANRAGGKLFICIHCNSMPTKPNPANGFETYVLSPAKSDIAVDVARRENAVIRMEEKSERYKNMNDEQLILATLAQNSFVKFSQHCATLVQQELDKATPMQSRGVNQAGFIVMIGASMPSVYVETGFLSNSNDEKTLTSDKGQLSIAKGIANAVKRYAQSYQTVIHRTQ